MEEGDSNYIGCPNCGVRYRWRNELASKKILCPCGCKFRMPNTGGGPPTTITLPPKGIAIVGAGLRNGPSVAESLPPQPIDTNDAVGELARLHLLDDLKQKIDNDGTLNTGRFVMPSSAGRGGQSSTGTSFNSYSEKLDTDDQNDPLLAGVPEQPAKAGTPESLANIAQSTRMDSGATGNYELNLDAFTPASSLISPSELRSPDGPAEPLSPPAAPKVGGEALSRAELKRRRQAELEEDVRIEHQRLAYVYPLGCAILGLLLIFADIFLLGPRVDQMGTLNRAERNAQSFFDFGSYKSVRLDEPRLPVHTDNSLVDVAPATQDKARPPLKSESHVMPQGLLASSDNAIYTGQVAQYKTMVDGPSKMIRRSVESIVYIIFSFIFGIVGILACIKLLGSGFDGLISLTLKLLAISIVLQGSMACMSSVLFIITEGLHGGGYLTMLLGLALFWAMCAWLLEMSWAEVLIMYLFARIFAMICMMSLVGILLYWMIT
jgi:hypothetical protein